MTLRLLDLKENLKQLIGKVQREKVRKMINKEKVTVKLRKKNKSMRLNNLKENLT